MKKTAKILVLAGCIVSAFTGRAQQDAMISQYMTNQLFINPAYSGTHTYSTLSGLYRKQWVSFPGSPQTGFLTYDTRFPETNYGLGFTFANDKIGVSEQTDLSGNFSYHIPLLKGELSLALKAAISHYNAYLTELTVWDQNDAVFMNNITNRWIPNFGAGGYYYTDKFYLGLAVPHLLNYQKPSSFLSAKISSVPAYERHYYLTSGYVYKLNDDVFLKPSFLLKYVPDAPFNADLNLNVFFMNFFSVGMSYKTDNELVGMIEINASKHIRIGYAYDHTFNPIGNYSDGSHEIMVAYDFFQEVVKMKTPRFF
jgi:type IX secretion system PorP/SprF family membrane protein